MHLQKYLPISSIVILFVLFATPSGSIVRPHIIFIIADDLGWNDVSFHGSPQIPTPNIDALAASGVVLQNYYTASLCSPSRGSLMTGRYPVNIGLQRFLLSLGEPSGLPLNFTLLPKHLKSLGYATSMVGKWHLGYFKKEYTPTYRGFDNFFGYYSGRIDYFDHTAYQTLGEHISWGVDLHDGLEVQTNLRGQYAADLFTDRAVRVIQDHDATKPLFMYMSQISPHFGNPFAQLQALPKAVSKFPHIKDMQRRIFAGMIEKLDECVGRIFEALWKKQMLNNAIVVLVSDNGGTSMTDRIGPGSNWPLRGQKSSLWEGGVRVPALIWSPVLGLTEPVTSEKLMHVSDWLPTLYSAAGGNIENLGELDGLNFWPHIADQTPSPRYGVLLNIEPEYSLSAIRVGDYKLIQGDFPGVPNKWEGPSGRDDVTLTGFLDDWVWKNGSVVKDILEEAGWWLVKSPDSWRVNLTVHCGDPPAVHSHPCDPTKRACLFNIVKDPCEYHDVSHLHPRKVQRMKELIREFDSNSWPSVMKPFDLKSLPECHGFAHVPWMDKQHQHDCP